MGVHSSFSFLVVLLLSSVVVFSNVEECRGEGLTVHVVAHTHDDVGWLKTVDEYYYGANQSIQDAGVQYILDTVIDALRDDPDKKFIYVEIAFFIRWWREQSEARKDLVRSLVSSGQLEFINGGWCMNDEGATHYDAVIDQMTEGHQFLLREFGVVPRIGWHIDPFGHSATQASLFAQMGFDAFFFGRIDYQDHLIRNETKELEFVWRGSPSLGKETEIWSHNLYTDYCYLHGFAWEYGDTPIQTDPKLFDVNVKERSDLFASLINKRALAYRTKNIMAPFGCDFQFMNARLNFKNMDKLMSYINSHPEYGMKLIYSTPSIYMKAVHSADLTWSVKTGDFFPYADEAHAYWSGYFSSRPALKGYIRSRNSFLHATDKLFSTGAPAGSDVVEFVDQIDVLTQAFSVAQHHDSVTGTEQQHVAYDYAKRLAIGTEVCEEVVAKILGDLTAPSNPPAFSFCPLLNVSVCPASVNMGQALAINVYNPIAWKRNHFVTIPVSSSQVQVFDSVGLPVASQVFVNRDNNALWTLVFPVQLPPSGFSTYFVQRSQGGIGTAFKSELKVVDADIVLENDYVSVTFSESTGRMSSIYNKDISQNLKIDQDMLWWNGSAGNNKDSDQASGAYIFRPNGTEPFPMKGGKPTMVANLGPLVSEVYQVWNGWGSQVTRVYTGMSQIEIEPTVGPIDISDGFGKEVFVRWSTDLQTKGKWYTDSQGQDMMERILNYRPWFNYTVNEPIASNYYPMNIAANIKDVTKQLQFTVVGDRSRGCSSLKDGQFENIIHRRLLFDDGRGVGEPLNESDIVRAKEVLIFDRVNASARQQRPVSLLLNNPPILSFSPANNIQEWINTHKTTFEPIAELPQNVHLLNLKTLEDGRVLLRLNHIYALGEDPELSRPAIVDLDHLFKYLEIIEITEMSLTANEEKADMNRLVWKTATVDHQKSLTQTKVTANQIELRPMQIRSFLVRFQRK